MFTKDRLQTVLDYNPDTGDFIWTVDGPRRMVGCGALVLRSDGHFVIQFPKKNYLASKIAWVWVNGQWPWGHVRFIDGDKTNLRIRNLGTANKGMNSWCDKNIAKMEGQEIGQEIRRSTALPPTLQDGEMASVAAMAT